MVTIENTFSVLDLIRISPFIKKLSKNYDSVKVFCKHEDFSLANALFFQIPNVILSPEYIKDSQFFDALVLNINPQDTLLPSAKQGLFISHMGIGDMINIQGAVNYFSESLDEIYVVCPKIYVDVAMDLYRSNKKIHLLTIDSPEKDICLNGRTLPNQPIRWSPIFAEFIQYFKEIHIGGIFLPNSCIWLNDWETYPIPDCFYVDFGLDKKIRYTHNTICSTQESKELYKPLEGKPYIFVHQKASNAYECLVSWDIQKILTIDPDTNLYSPEDPFYSIAQQFIKKNIFHYYDVIQNASEIYMIDSSFSCLGLYCKPLKATKKRYIIRNTKEETLWWFD